MTVAQTTATTEPTLLEKLHALEETAHRLATERDVARKIGSQATKDLVRARHQIHVADVDNAALRTDLDDVRAELRRALATCRNLAVEKGALEMQIDNAQSDLSASLHQPPKQRRWLPKRRGDNPNQTQETP